MLRATAVVRKAAVKPDRVADTVVLVHDGRHRRRVALKGEGGLDFLLDLAKAAALADGDAVRLEDGRLVEVRAAPQALLEIRAENPLRLMRVAWHIGNRHTPAEIGADAIWIEDDHVLAEMIRGQGCTATPVRRPFRPERGAYEPDCGHDHGHAHHAHHAHHHGRKPDDAPHHHDDHAHHHDNAGHSDHEHGPGCGHHNHGEHGHKHDHR
ncbi:MAG: urease accessory protein UreE [Microvirga sp.]